MGMTAHAHSIRRTQILRMGVALGTLMVLTGATLAETRWPEGKLSASEVLFVAFDTETTGLNPNQDRVLELGAVKFKNGAVVEEKSWLINPGRNIPYWVQRVHGIGPELVKDKPSFREVYPEFLAFIGGAVLMAHNARFDISFISKEAKIAGRAPPENPVVDSLGLFRSWYPEAASHKLSAMAEYADVQSDANFHRAMADSRYVTLIFVKALAERGVKTTLSDVYEDAGGPLSFGP